ncbi:MAG: Ig-like domain-containing protein, partial [Paludibacteraceae bacterium]|nr:Ig-like domain-containing protein [Paludibacteraceae bacterium]
MLVRNNDLLNSNATYYAVFAELTTSAVTSVEAASVKFNYYTGDDDIDVSELMNSMMAYDSKGIKKIGGTNVFIGKKGVKLGTEELTGWITLTLDKPTAVKRVVVDATAFGGDNCSIRVLAGRTMIDRVHSPAANMEYVAGEPVVSNTIKVAISEKHKHSYISKITVYEEENGTYSNYSTSCEGTATDSPIIVPVNNENLLITRDHINIDIDEYKPLAYTVAPYDKKSQSVTWTTSDPSVAIVSSKGMVLGISNGTATITGTATDGGYTATCEVKVGRDAPEELVFTGMFENRVKS